MILLFLEIVYVSCARSRIFYGLLHTRSAANQYIAVVQSVNSEVSLQVVEALLSGGANPEDRSGLLWGLMWCTPLDYASVNGHIAVVKLLLDSGANPAGIGLSSVWGLLNRTPLDAAAAEGHRDTIQALLHGGARPDNGITLLWGIFEYTTMETAVFERRDEVMRTLHNHVNDTTASPQMK